MFKILESTLYPTASGRYFDNAYWKAHFYCAAACLGVVVIVVLKNILQRSYCFYSRFRRERASKKKLFSYITETSSKHPGFKGNLKSSGDIRDILTSAHGLVTLGREQDPEERDMAKRRSYIVSMLATSAMEAGKNSNGEISSLMELGSKYSLDALDVEITESFEPQPVKSFAIFNSSHEKLERANSLSWEPVDLLVLPFERESAEGKDGPTFADFFKGKRKPKHNSQKLKMTSSDRKEHKKEAGMERTMSADLDSLPTNWVPGGSECCQVLGIFDFRQMQARRSFRKVAPATFARFAVRYLREFLGPQVASSSFFKGTLFLNVDEAIIDFGKDAVVRTVLSITKRFPSHALLLDGGMEVYEQVRDYIQGVVLRNSIINTNGRLRTRFGVERRTFEETVKKLNCEMALRENFLVLDVAVSSAKISPSLLRHYINWLQNYGFIGWVSHDANFASVSDIRSIIPFLGIADEGVFEIANRPDVRVAFEALYEMSDRPRLASCVPDPATWDGVLKVLNLPQVVVNHLSSIHSVTVNECSAHNYAVPKKPRPDTYGSEYDDTEARFRTFTEKFKPEDGSSRVFVIDDKKASAGLYAFACPFSAEERALAEVQLEECFITLKQRGLLRNYRFVEPGTALNVKPGDRLPQNAGFTELLTLLSDIVFKPSEAAKRLFVATEGELIRPIRMLLTELETGAVNVWLTNPTAFTVHTADADAKDKMPVPMAIATSRNEKGTIDVLIRDDVPSILGAVIHCYLKRTCRMSTLKCVMAESLLSAQKQSAGDFTLPIPQRFSWQVERSSFQECGTFLMNTVERMDMTEEDLDCTTSQLEFYQKVCWYIDTYAQYVMNDMQSYVKLLESFAAEGYAPANEFEKYLCHLIGKATMDQASNIVLSEVFKGIAAFIKNSQGRLFEKQPEHKIAFRYLLSALLKCTRRVAWEELEIALLTKNPVILPEADQVAVCLEMATTQSNLLNVFGLSSLQLSKIFYPKLRAKLFANQPNPNAFAKEVELKVDIRMEKRATNAFLFVYPIIIDLLLVNFTGSGIVFSVNMDAMMQQVTSLSFMIMFPFAGGLMNSIGRVCSYYFFQRSIPLAVTSFLRRLAGSCILCMAASILSALLFVVLRGATTENCVSALMGIAYSMAFVLYILFFSGIVCFRDEEEHIFESAGPLAILQSLVILVLPVPIVCLVTLPPFLVATIYVGSLTLGWIWLACAYYRAAQSYIAWPEVVKLPSDAQVHADYQKVRPRPQLKPSEHTRKYEKRVKLWERAARQHHMNKMNQAVTSTTRVAFSELVTERRAQYRRERLLMKYFFERNSVTDPPPRFSREWDMMLKQAIAELKKKFQVEKINRGDLLYEFEVPTIVFGVMYYLLIYIDRWAILLGNGEIIMFLPGSLGANYAAGMIWSSIFLLLSSGFLEFVLHYIAENERQIVPGRFGEQNMKELISAQGFKHIREYRRNLWFFVKCLLSVFVLVSFAVLAAHPEEPQVNVIFGISVAGYCCFLLGLFHKLYLKSNESRLNWALFAALGVGLATGITFSKMFDEKTLAILSIPASGWVFAVICIALFAMDSLDSSNPQIPLSPELMSSGCHWIRSPNSPEIEQHREKLLGLLIRVETIRQIRWDSALGIDMRRVLQTASEYYESLPDRHSFRLALPAANQLMKKAWDAFQSGQIVLNWKSQTELHAHGCNYAAITAVTNGLMNVYLAVPPPHPNIDLPGYAAELMIHEFVEVAGRSHRQACLFELLVACSRDRQLPDRVTMQLQRQAAESSRDLVVRGDRILLKEACLGIDIDRHWTSLSEDARSFLIESIGTWKRSVASHVSTANAPWKDWLPSEKPAEVIRQMMTLIGGHAATSEDPEAAYLSLRAVNNLSSVFALRVSDFCVRLEDGRLVSGNYAAKSSERIDVAEHTREATANAGKLPLFRHFLMIFENYGRILFLCLTDDVYFGRELDAINPSLPTRYFFWILLRFSRFLIRRLEYFYSYRSHPEMRNLLNLAKRGAYRTLLPATQKGPARVVMEDSPNGPMTCIFELAPNDFAPIDKFMPQFKPVLAHYAGSHPADFVPGEKDLPVVRSCFKNSTELPAVQLSHTYFYSGDKVTATCVYRYLTPSEPFPVRREVYEGQVPQLDIAADAINWLPKEVHEFNAKDHNLVANATLYRTVDSKRHTIKALYFYTAEEGREPYLNRIEYIQNSHDTDPWVMTVVCSGTTPKAVKHAVVDLTHFSDKNLVYRTRYNYSHPQHPRWHSSLYDANGTLLSEVVQTPPEVGLDTFGLLNTTYPEPYLSSNILIVPSPGGATPQSAWTARGNSKRFQYAWMPYDIQRKREALWVLWRLGKISGVAVRVLDEMFLREEPLFKQYWRLRDLGRPHAACKHLLANQAVHESLLRVPDTPSTRSHFHVRFTDLLKLGVGGDASDLSAKRDKSSQLLQGQELLPVLSLDSGTWPTGGGGVGSCRRDLIDNLHRVRWTVIAEIASADLVQRDYQVEKNVDKIMYVPLWDVDFGTPNENIYRNVVFAELRKKTARTTTSVIRAKFIPLVKSLVRFSAATELPSEQLSEAENVFVQLYLYFRTYDWLRSWHHPYTQDAWVAEWLREATEGQSKGQYLRCELPTLKELNMLYLLVVRLLLILTAEIPKDLPVVHSSHHGIQSILGVIAKSLYGASFAVWDHGILWRERLFALCEADNMPRFVQLGFVGLTRLVARISYMRADMVTPCTRVQNVDWEMWMGGEGGRNSGARIAMQNKISPVVNGMDISKFCVNHAKERPAPTAVMLSHISPVKDIKNAILAADYIVNRLKFKAYQLLIYGSKDKDPLYAADCANMINALNLNENVYLQGLGSPANVLPEGHLFLNSSITEGLPLALGEAGLCGLPVVCTDVGGSREVISDMATGHVYGRVVPPGVPKQLAIAQLHVLAMTDGLEQLVDRTKKPVTLDELLRDSAGRSLEERVMRDAVRCSRRALGGLLRKRIIENFSISRYWREHEQVLVLGKLRRDYSSKVSGEP